MMGRWWKPHDMAPGSHRARRCAQDEGLADGGWVACVELSLWWIGGDEMEPVKSMMMTGSEASTTMYRAGAGLLQ